MTANPDLMADSMTNLTPEAALQLRGYAHNEEVSNRLRRFVPAFRDGQWRLGEVHMDRFAWKGAMALEGTAIVARERASGAVLPEERSRRSVRVEFGEAADAASDDPFCGYDVERGMILRVSPSDPDLRLLEKAMTGTVELGGERLTDTRLLGHRFGRRATLSARVASGDTVLLKIFAKKRAERLARVMLSLMDNERHAADAALVQTPAVLHYTKDRRAVVLEYLPGHPLQTSWPTVRLADLERFGEALKDLAHRGAPCGNAWTAQDEIDGIGRFAARLALFDPMLAEQVEKRAQDAECIEPASAPCRVHRDLHDGQIVLNGPDAAIVDWDLAALGESEIDVGNFAAHLQLRGLQGLLPLASVAPMRNAFLRGAMNGQGSRPAEAQWEKLSLLRLTAVYGLRIGGGGLARRLLDATDRVEVTS